MSAPSVGLSDRILRGRDESEKTIERLKVHPPHPSHSCAIESNFHRLLFLYFYPVEHTGHDQDA